MTSLLLASLLFLGIHIVISGTPLRDRLVAMMGEKAYQGLFSLLSLGAIVWMSISYGRADYVELWPAPAIAVWLTPLLVFLAMLLAVIGLTTPNPTSAGAEEVLKKEHAASGIVAVTRHPFLWGLLCGRSPTWWPTAISPRCCCSAVSCCWRSLART